ncbi:MAG: PASTA domain-containing protein [Chloroflexota bacterium]
MVGLCHCPSCNVFACRWCWADADGACPRCDFPRAITIKPSVGGGIRLGPKIPRRRERRVPIAAGALVVVAAVLALTIGGWFRPTGAVLSVTDQPATTTADSSMAPLTSTSPIDGTVTPTDPTSPGIGTPLPTDSAVPGQTASAGSTAPPPAAHATPTPPPGATPKPPTQPPTARPTATPTPPGSTPTPAPTAAPTPTPTAAPTPTPDPTPTPVCHTVPDLVGMTVGAARSAWTAAGFTGSFLPLGQTNKIVLTQSQTPGDCIPADSSISVTFA